MVFPFDVFLLNQWDIGNLALWNRTDLCSVTDRVVDVDYDSRNE